MEKNTIKNLLYVNTVSQADELYNYIVGSLNGYAIITGGDFGTENSIITIILSLIIFALLYKKIKYC